MPDSLQAAARLFAASLGPLARDLSRSDPAILTFLEGLGWTLPSVPLALKALGTSAQHLCDAHLALEINLSIQTTGGTVSGDIGAQYVALASSVTTLLSDLRNLRSSLQTQLPPAFVAATDLPNQIPRRLLDLCVHNLMVRATKRMEPILRLAGIVEVVPEGADPAKFQPAYLRRTIRWDRLGKFLGNPTAVLTDVYGLGGPSFDAAKFLDAVMHLSFALAGPAEFDWPTPTRIQALTGILPAFDAVGLPQLTVPLIEHELLQAGVSVLPLPASAGTPSGVALGVYARGGVPISIKLSDLLTLQLDDAPSLATGLSVSLRPGQSPQARIGLEGPAGAAVTADRTGATLRIGSATPMPLFSLTESLKLEALAITVSGGVGARAGGPQPYLEIGLAGGKLTLGLGEGDNFIKQIMPAGSVELGLDLVLAWTPGGVALRGSGALSVSIPLHLQLGPFRISTLHVIGALSDTALNLETSITGGARFGLLDVTIERIGVQTLLTLTEGNLGPLDLTSRFKPPDGVGLELDAGGFKGGGFLRLYPDKGEYEGGLELTFVGTISVRAVGILSTRMPDGGKGFSLLIIIVSEFPPLQLSYGFTLVGVGGLLGLNRTVLLDALQAGVHDGSLNSILFPTDVVANATRIIGDLKRVFPPQDGRFLVGPMAKLGWGTPTLISLSVGLILEVPRPMFTFIGVLRMALPTDDVAVLHLQVSFSGGIDFERGMAWFDASLVDSRALTFTLTGDIAVRVYWKENANLLLTVGGFHPSYTPPPMNLGELARLGMVLFQGNPHISAQVYFAVTSNTVQFGAYVEAYYGIELFNVYGFLSFDVLINFDPFHFVAEIAAGLGVRSNSTVLFAIQLQLVLEGPTQWHARGTGSFRIGFIIKVTIKVGFDVTFGDARETRLPPVDVLAEVGKALGNLGNWRPRLPSGSNQHVTLRELPDPTKVLVLHPFGALEITQKLVPLHIAIQRFGSRAPDAGSVFTLADVKLGAEDAGVSNTREQFAPAQFFNLSDAEKLSRPSFADYDAGIVIGGDLAPRTDLMRTRDVVYELIYLPEHHPVLLFFTLAADLAGFLVRGSAVAQSSVSHAQRSVSVLEVRASLAPERYTVVSTNDLTLYASHLVFDNATAADQAVQRLVGERPELFGAIQVLPATAALAPRAA